MSRIKTFFMYFLIFVAFYIVSNLLINAYIKTSYYKITKYDIEVNEATVTIMNAKASKDDGYIEGKISNAKDEAIRNKYMVVELFSENGVRLGKEYLKIDRIRAKEIKDFKVNFSYDNVKSFKITFIDEAEKQKIDEERNKNIFTFKSNERVDKVIDELEAKRKGNE